MEDNTPDTREIEPTAASSLPPPLRKQRLLTGLTGEEISRRFPAQSPARSETTERPLVKRTYELEEAVVHGIRRQAVMLGVNANDLANMLLKDGLAALASGELEARVGILPEEQLRGPRSAGRYIMQLQRRDTRSEQSRDGEGEGD
jgi:hypothetical protein